MSEPRQSERLEEVRRLQQELLTEAQQLGDVTKVMQASKLLVATEKEISRVRREEGETLQRSEALEIGDVIAAAVVRVAKDFVADDRFDKFVDSLRAELAVIRERNA